LTPRKPRGFHSVEGWVGAKADLEVLEKKKKIFCAEIRTPDFPARALVSITPTHYDYMSKNQFSVVFSAHLPVMPIFVALLSPPYI